MWIVKIALTRPYTFIVLAILILIAAPVVIVNTPTDIFPNINIPVVSVAWNYTGLNPEELEGRVTTPFEKSLTVLVDNIQHIESTTVFGQVVVKIYLQPTASLDTANSQVSAASEFQLRSLPPGILPPQIINFSASSVPILQLGLSGQGLSEQQLNDLGLNFVRPALVTVPGAVIPNVYGGRQRSIMVNLDPKRLQAQGIAPTEVLNALSLQNVVQPGGTAKIGNDEYDIHLNSAPVTIAGLRDLPVKQSPNGVIVYLHDLASVSDGSIPQTNIVRQDGNRGVLVTVLKSGTASTLSVVSEILNILPQVKLTLPPSLQITPIGNQATFVRGSVVGVIREAVIAAVLTGLMILLFLGSWRSTIIIAISIPLSILSSVIVLGLLGQTINIMTLSGLALAVGILVDDATVTIENIERYLEEGAELNEGILQGAAQIATPALVSTLCICIVFLPMFFLSGVARYLFVPLAESVVFAMLASYVLSRTLVPTLAMYLLQQHDHHEQKSKNILARFQRGFEHGFERVRAAYQDLLGRLIEARFIFVPLFLLLCFSGFLLIPFLGQNFFPSTDNGSFTLHMRVKSGTRIEETAKLCDEVEQHIRKVVPAAQMDNILDNIGLPYSTLNFQHATSGLIGAGDADILVSLKENHSPTSDYVRTLRSELPREFPGTTFYFLPSDIVTQILNFGLPSPIDVQIDGPNLTGNRVVLNKILSELQQVPGLVDLRVQQPDNYPVLDLAVDRTKAAQGGYTERDVGSSVLNILSGSTQLSPQFYLNPQNGVTYNIVAQTPQYQITSLSDLRNIPIASVSAKRPEIVADVADIKRSTEMQVVTHYNIRRTLDIYGNVQDRDLGAVAKKIDEIVKQNTPALPRGSFIHVRGQIETMRSSYIGLIAGLGFAIVLVYLLIVVNFQSWLDPFIIITALPGALAGIVMLLFITQTTLSVPALMGAIMCMGVATANSILVVSFAKERFEEHGDGVIAALESGATRFRPVMMTALAMIIGMIPMALGAGEGGEENAPLGRAVIGGLSVATVATLIFVPAVSAAAWPPQGPGRGGEGAKRNRECGSLKMSNHENALETHLDDDRHDVSGPGVAAPKRGLPGIVWLGLLVIAVVIAVVVVMGILARASAEKKLADTAKAAAVPTVSVTHPYSARLTPELSLPGNAQAYVETPIYSRTDGYLKSWYFDIGARVKAGQLMAVIETPELDEQLQVAQAQLKSSQANLDLANITSARYQNLLKSNSVSKQETDQALSDAKAKQAAVEASNASVRRLQQLQSFERVYAPFDGIVTERNTDVGQLIQGGSSPHSLFHLAAIGTIRVFVPVPESYAGAVRDGGTATLTLDEYPGREFIGQIARNSSTIDSSSRTLNVEVDVANPKAEILPGAYVFAHFKVPDQIQGLTLPSNALIFRSAGLQVGVVRNGRVVLVPVTISNDSGALIEISSGLRASDLVVLDPSDSLSTGQPVIVKEVKNAGAK